MGFPKLLEHVGLSAFKASARGLDINYLNKGDRLPPERVQGYYSLAGGCFDNDYRYAAWSGSTLEAN